METQQELDYKRVASAISFFRENYRSQPKLDEVAGHVHLSPFHFQRMFHHFAGVTPKQFLQYLTIEHAKGILKATGASLFDAAHDSGLSGTSRLHDLFIKIEGMTPGEYKNGGELLSINYSFVTTPFGKVLIASTAKGICHMAFTDEDGNTNDTVSSIEGYLYNREQIALSQLKGIFPNACYQQMTDDFQRNASSIFSQDWSKLDKIKLHLKGTVFQVKVWETLLAVPSGRLTTYADLARNAGYTGASRAVGTAVGRNPVAFLIPCHRVIKATGDIGQYHWGAVRKQVIIGWEAALSEADDSGDNDEESNRGINQFGVFREPGR